MHRRHVLDGSWTHIIQHLHKLHCGEVVAGGLEQLRGVRSWQVLPGDWSFTVYRLYRWHVLLSDWSYIMQQLCCGEVVAAGLGHSCKLCFMPSGQVIRGWRSLYQVSRWQVLLSDGSFVMQQLLGGGVVAAGLVVVFKLRELRRR